MSALPSERDQNFLITDARRGKFVLKIANSTDALALLDCQNQAMRQVEKAVADYRVQRIVRSLEGADITTIHNARSGSDHWMRLLTWLDGAVLADSAARSSVLYESIGAGMAKIDAALCDFSHPAMRRVLQWDLRRAGMAREHAALLPQARRAHVERLFSQWREIDWTGLRHSAIHGDANDHNVLVVDGRMAGLLDFGDMVYSATVCDLAVVLPTPCSARRAAVGCRAGHPRLSPPLSAHRSGTAGAISLDPGAPRHERLLFRAQSGAQSR